MGRPDIDHGCEQPATRPRLLYPLAYRLQVLGVGMAVIGLASFALTALVSSSSIGSLMLGYLVCSVVFGAWMIKMSGQRLRDSLSKAKPVPVDTPQRSHRAVLLRTLGFLVGIAATMAILQGFAQAIHTSLGIAPGILTGSAWLALWNRSTVREWEVAIRLTILAQSELQWSRNTGPFYATESTTPEGRPGSR